MRSLHEVVPQTLHAFDPGADLVPAYHFDVDIRDTPYTIEREQRREAIVVAHHERIGELAAQCFDLEAIGDGLKVAHRV